jgi:hypothetical protein
MGGAHASIFLYRDVHERPGDAGTYFYVLGGCADHGNKSSIKAPNQKYFPVVEIRKKSLISPIVSPLVEGEKSRPFLAFCDFFFCLVV